MNAGQENGSQGIVKSLGKEWEHECSQSSFHYPQYFEKMSKYLSVATFVLNHLQNLNHLYHLTHL